MIATLALAPPAAGELGVVGFHELPRMTTLTGQPISEDAGFYSGGALTVAANGSGDAYISDPGGNRITQVSVEGEVKRVFGFDVVAAGPNNANERQAIRIAATEGTFTLTFGGETTGPIPYDADPAVVKAELDGLVSIGGVGGSVGVVGGPGDADGSAPYAITFEEASGGANQPRIALDASDLGGGLVPVYVATLINGGTGFEVCEPADGDICKQGNGNPGQIEVEQESGDVLAVASGQVVRYSADGERISVYGNDVVRSGQGDSDVDEVQEVAIRATGGSFSLQINSGTGNEQTEPIHHDAPAVAPPNPGTPGPDSVEEALNTLPGLLENGGVIEVTGGPGDRLGSNPYVVAFGGTLAGDNVSQLSVQGAGLTSPLPSASASSVRTLQEGGGPEVCTAFDECKGTGGQGNGAIVTGGTSSIAVAPVDAPNHGNVIVGSAGSGTNAGSQVLEFDATGEFVRSFGWDSIRSGPGDSGSDERRDLTVKAGGGRFSITFAGQTTGAVGVGDRAEGSATIANFGASSGAFAAGQVITGAGIPAGTTIEAVNAAAGTLTLSQAATANSFGTALTGHDLPYNATPQEVEDALDALPGIGGVGGSVEVQGGVGNPAGDSPYQITFAGTLGGDDIPDTGAAGGMSASTAGLTIGSGSPSANVAVGNQGGRAFEVCKQVVGAVCKFSLSGSGVGQLSGSPRDLTVDSDGVTYTLEESGRVQTFAPAGGLDLTPDASFGANEQQMVTVNAAAGSFRLGAPDYAATVGAGTITGGSTTITGLTVSKGAFAVGMRVLGGCLPETGAEIVAVTANSLTLAEPALSSSQTCINGQLAQIQVHGIVATSDLPHDASPEAVEAALKLIPPIASGDGSVSVSGGPGDAGGSSPYLITFNGGARARSEFPLLKGLAGSTPLSGGAGPGANQATVTRTTLGVPKSYTNAFGLTTPAEKEIALAAGPGGEIRLVRRSPEETNLCENGFPSRSETRILELSPDGGSLITASKSCSGVGSIGSARGFAIDPATGEAYLPATNRLYVFGELGSAPQLTLNDVSNVAAKGATISGEIDPNGPGAIVHPNPSATEYEVEFRKAGETGWQTFLPLTKIGTSEDPIPFTVGISGLAPKTAYEARVRVRKPFGFATITGPTQSFTTLGAPPTIDSFSSSEVTATSAKLHATVNPQGTATRYYFEYGTSANYGASTPEVEIGESLTPVTVQQHIDGLDPVLHHFRVVAVNDEGEARSTNQTFSFYPELCPNATVRQQTGSGGLPDCRAYELVSPSYTGSTSMHTGGPSSPFATSPPRFSFHTALNGLPGPWSPNSLFADAYLASRTDTGWETAYVGGPSDRFILRGQPYSVHNAGLGSVYADRGLERLLQWPTTRASAGTEMAPYVTDWRGEILERWPTNAAQVPGALDADTWEGDVEPSADLSHYFFSSANLAFAPGGLTGGIGSAYDNDTATGEVEIVSKLPAGGDIPREPGSLGSDYLRLPGSSADGSHILMLASQRGVCGAGICPPPPDICDGGAGPACSPQPGHLYMRVGGAVTYDVSRGHSVNFEGMTDDGSRVLFTTTAKVTPDDQDTSADLYMWMWSEGGDEVTRLSATDGGAGNVDGCSATWVQRCGVAVVATDSGRGGFGFNNGNQELSEPTDNAVGRGTGAVYFYSPEQFVGANGVPGRRNLYVWRDGEVDYVATLDVGEPARRIQVSPDGRFAAFVTATRLTTYDNGGFETMYVYDDEAGQLACASCAPSGDVPGSDVEGSQNGLFMADDGRAFFSTDDALVPADTNGHNDVYEFVGSRPQLITTGTSSTERSSAGEPAGLVGVGADGVDVYFSTTDRLVPADRNGSGSFLKFYDARTGGGFPVAAAVAPCAAADECHGGGSAAPVAPRVASAAALGASGNVPAPQRKAKRKAKRAKAKRARAAAKRCARKAGKAKRRCLAARRAGR